MNQTMAKFGYPETLVREYACWTVQLRPKQATLGALVAVCKEPARSFSEISAAAFAELGRVTADIESALGGSFAYAKINYLMLMMTDPDVHFHVLPRYPEAREFAGVSFSDPGWPGPPDIKSDTPVDAATRDALVELLKSKLP